MALRMAHTIHNQTVPKSTHSQLTTVSNSTFVLVGGQYKKGGVKLLTPSIYIQITDNL